MFDIDVFDDDDRGEAPMLLPLCAFAGCGCDVNVFDDDGRNGRSDAPVLLPLFALASCDDVVDDDS